MATFRVNKELRHRWNSRVQWILNENFQINDSPKEKSDRIERARKDYAFFVNTYFSRLAPKKCAKFQLDAANYLKSHPETRALFEWGRGHAKSSHLSLMIPLWLKI